MGRAFLIGTVAGILATSFAFADSPSVTAVLSKSEAVVGEDVQLEIRLTGARGADAQEQIPVDGLEIHRTGTSQRVEINNFNLTASVSYDYTVVPLRAGRFTIPPQTIRLGYDPRTHPQLTEPPEIIGQGFTAQKLQQSSENLETINGRTYNIVTFKSAIAAVHSGKLEIGPVKAKAQVVVPRRLSSPRSRSPFDLFDRDDPFSDPFFSNPFGQFGERREVEISSEPVTLDVKALPQNAPPSFSGAIGNFTMTTEAKPKNVQVGDPITVTSTISGRGNFDRVNAPVVEDERGWHKYPPSSKCKQDDGVGISGTNTFETVFS